jgi:prepilin peptidase CpaA
MQSLVLLIWFTLCAEQNIRLRQIADSLTLGGGLCALLYLFSTGHTWLGASVAEGAFALALSMALTLPAHLLGRLSAADVKLLGSLALATDQVHWLATLLSAVIIASGWVLMGPALIQQLSKPWQRRVARLAPDGEVPLPVTPFLLAGFLAALAWVH